MKNLSQIAQFAILVSLIAAAGLMMSGILTMPSDPETRLAVMTIGGIMVAILDPKGLRKEKEIGKTDTAVDGPAVQLHDDRNPSAEGGDGERQR